MEIVNIIFDIFQTLNSKFKYSDRHTYLEYNTVNVRI